MHLCFESSVCQAVLLEQLESMEAKLKVREQELRSKAQGVEDRERRVAAAAAQVAAREAECADRWRQLDRRHDNIVAREQQLGAAERHVHARAQDLGAAHGAGMAVGEASILYSLHYQLLQRRHNGCDMHWAHARGYRVKPYRCMLQLWQPLDLPHVAAA
jgi:hypothetical protein